jgi:hypothetical protein
MSKTARKTTTTRKPAKRTSARRKTATSTSIRERLKGVPEEFKGTAKIVALRKETGRRDGSEYDQQYKLMRGKTVGRYLEAGGAVRYIRSAIYRGFAQVK